MSPSPRSRRRTRHSVSGRRLAVTVVSMVLLLVVGIVGVVVGVVVQTTPERREAVALVPGEPYTAPERVPFVGALVVYGTPPEGERPDLDELGCQVTEGGGALSVDDARLEDRIVVDDRGLVPLVSFPGGSGHSIACAGPGAEAAAPLYVIPGRNNRTLLPLAGYSLAALCLPLSVLGLLNARWSRG